MNRGDPKVEVAAVAEVGLAAVMEASEILGLDLKEEDVVADADMRMTPEEEVGAEDVGISSTTYLPLTCHVYPIISI